MRLKWAPKEVRSTSPDAEGEVMTPWLPRRLEIMYFRHSIMVAKSHCHRYVVRNVWLLCCLVRCPPMAGPTLGYEDRLRYHAFDL